MDRLPHPRPQVHLCGPAPPQVPAAHRRVLRCGFLWPPSLRQPAAGQAGAPPLPADYRYIGGMGEFNMLEKSLKCVRDPEQLQPTMDRFIEMGQESRKKRWDG